MKLISNRILAAAIVVTALACFAFHQSLAGIVVFLCAPTALAFAQQPLGIQGIAFDVQLTNFAHGIAPDYTSALAELMAPQCIAPAAAGQYVAFDDDEAFRYIETKRALGGKGARLTILSDEPTFNCEPHSLEIPTDVFEYEKVGDAGIQMLREAKIRTLVSRNALSREKRVFDVYATVSPEAGIGDWTDPDEDPIDDLNGLVSDLATQTGQSNIYLVIGLGALRQIGKHPKVIARFPGASLINVTAEVLGRMLLFPVQVKVAMIPVATEKTGKAAVKSIIGNAKVYALLSQANPSPFDPSAAKTFTTRLGQVQGVGVYQEPPFAEINFMAWSEDIKLTGTKCVKAIDVTLGAIGS